MSRFAPNIKLAAQRSFVDFLKGKKIMPTNVEVSLCGYCNSTCPWCFYAGKHTGTRMDYWNMTILIGDLALAGVKSITYTGGGEPTLHPDFKRIIEYAHKHGIKQGLITNALKRPNYDPTLFEWIRISITPQSLKTENLKILRKCKTLGICINDTGNDEIIRRTLNIAKRAKLDYVQVRPALNTQGRTTKIRIPRMNHPLLEKTPYKYEDAGKKHNYTRCYGHNFCPFVWEDGEVYACAYHKGNNKYRLGNIREMSFKEIMRESPKSFPVIKTCQVCCKNHEINKFVNEALKIKDGDFI